MFRAIAVIVLQVAWVCEFVIEVIGTVLKTIFEINDFGNKLRFDNSAKVFESRDERRKNNNNTYSHI